MRYLLAALICFFSLVIAEEGDTCELTELPPKKRSYPLEFCYRYSMEDSCCIPAQEVEIKEHFDILNDVGDHCAKALKEEKQALREIFCLGCSNLQPKYLVNGTLKICSSLANIVEPSKFDDCGMIQVAERGNPIGGDDVVIPSIAWPTVHDFLNDDTGGKPPFLEDYDVEIVECDKSKEDCDDICFTGTSSADSLPVGTLLPVLCASMLTFLTLRAE